MTGYSEHLLETDLCSYALSLRHYLSWEQKHKEYMGYMDKNNITEFLTGEACSSNTVVCLGEERKNPLRPGWRHVVVQLGPSPMTNKEGKVWIMEKLMTG